jgi:orotate phosphoribosyltransferase
MELWKEKMMQMDAQQELGEKIVRELYKEGMILTWYRDRPQGWTLASGLYSPLYINLRLICSADPELYRLAGKAMAMLLKKNGFVSDGKHRMVGIAMAGIPLANAATLESGVPSLYTRKLPEDVKTPEELDKYIRAHGQKALVEGDFEAGDRLAMVDDLVSTFDSKLLARSQIEQEIKRRDLPGVTVGDVFVLLDREQGGVEAAKKSGMNLHSLIPFASKGLDWLKDSLSEVEYTTIKDYLSNPQKYQTVEMREKLRALAQKG